jgi:hypothetical protein
MAAKRTPSRPKRKSAKATAQPSPTTSVFAMATRSVVNMVAVTAVSGSVLFTLLAIKHF